MNRGRQKKAAIVVVAAIIIWTGLQNMISGRIYGRVRLANSEPLLEGWYVHLLGGLLIFAGIVMVFRIIRNW